MYLDNAEFKIIELIFFQKSNAGRYRCEVSGEAPDFETDYKEANMTVIGTKFIK